MPLGRSYRFCSGLQKGAAVVEVRPGFAMAQGPVADAVGASIQHRGEGQLRAVFIRPPWGKIQKGIKTKLVMPASQGHGG